MLDYIISILSILCSVYYIACIYMQYNIQNIRWTIYYSKAVTAQLDVDLGSLYFAQVTKKIRTPGSLVGPPPGYEVRSPAPAMVHASFCTNSRIKTSTYFNPFQNSWIIEVGLLVCTYFSYNSHHLWLWSKPSH